jgi:hypothetical protein
MAAQRIADRADLGFRRFGNSVPYRVVEVAPDDEFDIEASDP